MAVSIQQEIDALQGTWKQIGYERDGVREPHDEEEGWEPRATFTGNTFMVTIADGDMQMNVDSISMV